MLVSGCWGCSPSHTPGCPHRRDVSTASRDVSKDVLGRFGTFRDVYHFWPANQRFFEQANPTSNYRLRAALTQAGLLPDDLAQHVKVDVKTVQRWLGGRTPHPRHRTQVAKALGVDELELWPDATPTTSTDDPLKEIVGVYPHANDPDAPDWHDLIKQTSERIDLLDPILLLIDPRRDRGCSPAEPAKGFRSGS